MSRKSKAIKREILPDTVYNSKLITKFVNKMMYDGKKSINQKIFYDALAIFSDKLGDSENKLANFLKAVENIKPLLEVKSRRVGGATYQVPIEVRDERREALAIKWIIAEARNSSGNSMEIKLSNAIFNAYNSTGSAYKKKEDTHKMAEANRAFAHYRW